MNGRAFEAWVELYRGAWESNDPEEIGILFAEDAEYFHKPDAEPWRGREEIVRRWLENKDEPGETTFSSRVLAVEGALGIVRGVTGYRTSGRTYDNLWEIELDDAGRCTRFVEWWIERDA